MSSTTSNIMLLGYPEYRAVAKQLAEASGYSYAEVQIHRFPDGESKITLPDNIPERVIVCRTLHQPNNKLIELELTAVTARKLGARHITLVAPYLPYMRQDKAFDPGDAVSQQIIGEMLARLFDAVITVDPHLHRIDNLQQAIPMDTAIALNATQPMADFLNQQFTNPLLIGPDQESEQWVSAIAAAGSSEYVIATKQRTGDHDVAIHLPNYNYSNRHLVLIDDIASTGRTLEETVLHVTQYQPASITVMVTHALFVEDSVQRLFNAGVSSVISSNSIPHDSNQICLVPILTDALIALNKHSHYLAPATCSV